MKATRKTPKNKYPYLGISDLGIIILFTSKNTGVVMDQLDYKLGTDKEIGEYSDNIAEGSFNKYDGEVTISN